jgi:queuosine precursor transporter
MRLAGILSSIAFVACIILANYATAHYQPWHIIGLIVTAGTWFAAVTFILRDVVQVAFGRAFAYGLIAFALIVNFAASRWVGDLAWITFGSAVAFALSETIDSEVFTRYRAKIGMRVFGSGILASLADSLVFCVIALSPLTTGFVAWGDLWRVVAALMLAKFIVVSVGSAISAKTLPQPVPA